MRYRDTWSLVFASIFTIAGATVVQSRDAETPKVPAAQLITKDSVGSVRLGMTVAQVRRTLPKLQFARTTDGEGMALIEVKSGDVLEMILYAGEENPDSPIDDQAKVQGISVFGEAYKTAEGVHPGMPLGEVEKRYGKLEGIDMSEIESREYAYFANGPADLLLRVGLPDIGIAGKYAEGKRETKNYIPSAVIRIIEVYSSGETEAVTPQAITAPAFDPGYSIAGRRVTFSYDPAAYAFGKSVSSVVVAGTFNGWSTNSGAWRASDDDRDGRWTLTADSGVVTCGSQFKFVVNGTSWQQPGNSWPSDQLVDDGHGGFNIVVVCK